MGLSLERTRSPPLWNSSAMWSKASGFAIASRVATASGAWPISNRLTGTSRSLPVSVRGTAGTSTIASGTWRGEQSARMRRRRSASTSAVNATSSSTTTNKVIDDSVVPSALERRRRARRRSRERQGGGVDLSGAHPDAAAVDRRVRAAVHDGRAALGDPQPVAVTPHAWIRGEVRVVVALPVRVVPEPDRHRWHRLGDDQLADFVHDALPRSSQASTATPSMRAGISPSCTGTIGQPPTNALATSVPPDIDASQMCSPSCSRTHGYAVAGQRGSGCADRPQTRQITAVGRAQSLPHAPVEVGRARAEERDAGLGGEIPQRLEAGIRGAAVVSTIAAPVRSAPAR